MDDVFDTYKASLTKKDEKFDNFETVVSEEATLVNKKKRSSDFSDVSDSLDLMIRQATYLATDKKEKYLMLAEHYMSDMQHNLFKSQFELVNEYPDTNIDMWAEFLNDRIVSNYIDKHKRTVLKSNAEIGLADPFGKNKRENLKLLQDIETKDKKDRQNNIVIIRIPDKYSKDEE